LPVLVVDNDAESPILPSIDPTVLAIRGTLAGDVLWLATIAFVLAIISGMFG
jgi:hypothetical protein